MSERYADVIVDLTAMPDRVFQYRIPDELEGRISQGTCVEIPFGRSDKRTRGYVIGISGTPGIDPSKIKTIIAVSELGIDAESGLIRLAAWMKKTYGSSMIQALKTTLPVRERENRKTEDEITLAEDERRAAAILSEYRRKHSVAKERLLAALLSEKSMKRSDAQKELKITLPTIRSMQKEGVIAVSSSEIDRLPSVLLTAGEAGAEPAELSDEQVKARDGILRSFREEPDKPCLLAGVTGSGKTLVYMDLAERTLAKDREVIVLIPEIALSWQIVRRFAARFGKKVAVIHSRMGKSERYDEFERVKRGEAKIVIGPRSALFTPFSNLGLIIIDEEQEGAYQSDETPRYDARETAIERGRIENARVLFGSATPSFDSFHRAEQGTYRLFVMKQRYGGADLPDVSIVDMRKELRAGNTSMLSGALREQIAERLERHEQTILFLNKRGYTSFLSCRSCGHVIKCPHCDVSLTAHRGGRLICHYCGYEQPMVRKCPACGSPHIGGFRAGTEMAENIVKKEFPEAGILRMDADTTHGKEGHEKIVKAFAAHQADILIGTQMIVKGHDFPDVTLVGVLLADLSLFESDYRSGEHTYQLLVQAIGRAGRGRKKGLALIQTYHPDEPCIQAAARQDYRSFYDQEMGMRRILGYPPCGNMLAIHGSSRSEEKLDRAMEYIAKYLAMIDRRKQARLIGPAPESVSKIKDYYRRVLYIKTETEDAAVRMRTLLEAYIDINSGFRDVLFTYDLNR
jgi:primosomal protein N' (replication factor Y)